MNRIDPRVIEAIIKIANDPHERYKLHMKQAHHARKMLSNNPEALEKLDKIVKDIKLKYKASCQ